VVVVIGAGFILYRLNRLSLPFSYFIVRSAMGMALGQAPVGLEMFLLPNVFFAFVMVVEPKTSPGKRPAQWLFGAVCGAAAAACYEWIPFWDGDLLGLLLANAARPALERAGKRLASSVERRVEEGVTT
jgi:Na+-translocating ferredoxin:NAD+ oxidoreductase RnfD subunit